MSDARHTPEPWYCEPHRNGSGRGTEHDWTILGNRQECFAENGESDGDSVTVVGKVLGNETAGDIPQANAARIVAAVNACERGRLWSFIRDVLEQGAAIDHASRNLGEGYERVSAHLDAAARELADKFLTTPGEPL